MHKTAHSKQVTRKGAIAVLFAVFLPIVLLIAGFGIFVSWAQLVRTELRTATDLAARASAKQFSLTQNKGSAIASAIDTARRNTVAGSPLNLSSSSVQLGFSSQSNASSKFLFSAGGSKFNGVNVNGVLNTNDPVSSLLTKLSGLGRAKFEHVAIATNLDRDICVVIDRSGSMGLNINSRVDGNGQNCGPMASDTRFAALADAMKAFVVELNDTPQSEFVCLASYSSAFNLNCSASRLRYPEAEIHSVLSQDVNALLSPIAQMMKDGIGGGTAIGSGLQMGIQAVQGPAARPFAVPTIILMTDGNHNTGIDPEPVARDAAAQNITVHTITFSPAANQTRMKDVAKITGGLHFHANSALDLAEAFREIARTLPVMLTK